MELRRWLNRGYELSKRLAVKKAHMESIGNVISNYKPRETTSTPIENSSETNFIRWSELKKEVDEMSYKLLTIDRQVEAEIRKLGNPNEYQVLYCRYIMRLAWDDVARATHYSKQRVYALHKDGIENVERINGYREWEGDI